MNAQQKQEWQEYQKRINACKCLSAERKGFIQAAMDFAEDFPDGAFMAYMEETGIDVSELKYFSTTHICNKPHDS